MDAISVELKLDLDKYKAGVNEALQYLNAKMAESSKAGAGTPGVSQSISALNAAQEKAANASAKAAAATEKAANKASEKAQRAAQKQQNDLNRFYKDMSVLMMPIMRPTSPWGTLFASRQAYTALSGTKAGQHLVGMSGMGAGALTALVVGGAVAIGLALKGLAKIISGVMEAIRKAETRYATALQSGGLGLGFTTRRSMLADIIGVSEKEVFEYGRAIMYLNEKLAFAQHTAAATAVPLTEVGWAWKVLKENLSALFSQLAEGSSGGLRDFITQISDLLVTIGKTKIVEDFGSAVAILMKVINLASGIANAAASLILLAFRAIADSVGFLIKTIVNLLARIPGAGRLGIRPMEMTAGEVFAGTIQGWAYFKKQFKNVLDNMIGANAAMPEPMGYMKRLPVSSMEKMGFVIGGGIGGIRNYDSQIAQNTKKTAEGTHALLRAIIPRSGQFIVNPSYSNP